MKSSSHYLVPAGTTAIGVLACVSSFVLPLCSCSTTGDGSHAAVRAPGSSSVDPGGPVEPAIVKRLADDVTWLADDARMGRRAGTPGEAEAAAFLAERLASVGIAPLLPEGYLQPFTVPLTPRDRGGSFAVVPSAGRSIRGPENVVPLPGSAPGRVRGSFAFRGFGIVREELGWDDYGGALPEGAIVLLVRGAPAAPSEPTSKPASSDATVVTGGGFGETTALFHKLMTARRMGAAGAMIAPHPDARDDALPRFAVGGGLSVPIPAVALSAEAAERLWPGYEEASRALMTTDYAHWKTGGSRGREGKAVELMADVERADGTATNVLGLLEGGDGPAIVIGAHFDHLGHGGPGSLDPSQAGVVHNGADDNASGTAVVLEVARRLATAPEPPVGDVIFAFWSGEELGLLGSEHWAAQEGGPLDAVAANINLDMVGRAGSGKLQVLGAGSSATFAEWIDEAGAAAGLELEVSLSGSGLGGSDHQTFLKREIPALHLFSGLHEDYHKPSDDVERFEAEGAARVADLAIELLLRTQTAPDLTFIKPEIPEGEQRESRWRVSFGTVPEYVYDGKGLLLAGTSPGSPAEAAGFQKGDIILQVGDVEIEDIHSFVYMLQLYKPGDVVLTRFMRDGEEQSVRVTLMGRAPE